MPKTTSHSVSVQPLSPPIPSPRHLHGQPTADPPDRAWAWSWPMDGTLLITGPVGSGCAEALTHAAATARFHVHRRRADGDVFALLRDLRHLLDVITARAAVLPVVPDRVRAAVPVVLAVEDLPTYLERPLGNGRGDAVARRQVTAVLPRVLADGPAVRVLVAATGTGCRDGRLNCALVRDRLTDRFTYRIHLGGDR